MKTETVHVQFRDHKSITAALKAVSPVRRPLEMAAYIRTGLCIVRDRSSITELELRIDFNYHEILLDRRPTAIVLGTEVNIMTIRAVSKLFRL